MNSISRIQVNPRTVAEIFFSWPIISPTVRYECRTVCGETRDDVSGMCNITNSVYSIRRIMFETDIGPRNGKCWTILQCNEVRIAISCVLTQCRGQKLPSLISPLCSRFLSKWKRLLRKRAGSTPAPITIVAISSPDNFYSLWWRRH